MIYEIFFLCSRPLQFSFLGQIYKTKSSSGSSSSKKQRRCTSQKVTSSSTSSSRNHVLEASSTEDFQPLNSDLASSNNLSTQVILENWKKLFAKTKNHLLVKRDTLICACDITGKKVALNVFCISRCIGSILWRAKKNLFTLYWDLGPQQVLLSSWKISKSGRKVSQEQIPDSGEQDDSISEIPADFQKKGLNLYSDQTLLKMGHFWDFFSHFMYLSSSGN